MDKELINTMDWLLIFFSNVCGLFLFGLCVDVVIDKYGSFGNKVVVSIAILLCSGVCFVISYLVYSGMPHGQDFFFPLN